MIHYLDPNPAGSPAVLFLHGLGADATSWAFQFPPLIQAGMRPIAVDVPGFGKSDYDGRGWGVSRMAALTAGLMGELNTGPAYICGLSMGGTIAQQLVLDFPHLARKLILVSTFTVLRPESLGTWLYFAQRLLLVHTVGLKYQAPVVARHVFSAPEDELLRQELIERITSADPRAYRAAMRSLGWFDSRKRLKQIKIPVLVITGDRDQTVSPLRQKMLAEGIPGARQLVIAGAGHGVSVQKPVEFNLAMMDFLAD
jgi:pimeloyl-ACP methyl ester carboxylesterase